MRHKAPADETAAAAEWRAANTHMADLAERIRKVGYQTVSPDEYRQAHERIDAAAAAIVIPDHLMTYNADDWPGAEPYTASLTIDPLKRLEQHRQAQDRWAVERKLWRGDFEDLQRRQFARTAPPERVPLTRAFDSDSDAPAKPKPKNGRRRRAAARST